MMNFSTIAKNANRILGRTSLIIRKASPNLLIGFGIAGTGVAVVMACKATTKLDEILTRNENQIKEIEAAHNGETKLPPSVTYTEEDYRKDMMLAKLHTAGDIVKLYGPTAAIWLASAGCIVGGNRIHNVRNAALAAAYKAVDEGFKMYRSNVIAEQGEEADFRYKNGLKVEDLKRVMIADEHGENIHEETQIQKSPNSNVEGIGDYGPSMYAKLFSKESSKYWSPIPEYNRNFLVRVQNQMTDRLHVNGHLFLNEVLDALDLEHTKAGQMVGWLSNGDGDGRVDFGIYDHINGKFVHPTFLNENTSDILLDFNVDGNIYDLMDDRDGLRFRRER